MDRNPVCAALLSALLLLPAVAIAGDDDAALMKACPVLAAWAATHPHGSGRDQAAADESVSMPALRAELRRRALADQKARDALIVHGGQDKALGRAVGATDAGNLAWLKSIVTRQGFPTLAQVGAAGLSDAWLLVQHADSDPRFQASVLDTLQARPPGSGVRKADLALLTDRVLRAQGKRQRYGSQFVRGKGGDLALAPTEDLAHVDQRRARMGLMPLNAYRCMLQVTYGLPAPTR